jgi:flagellar motor protein MotB
MVPKQYRKALDHNPEKKELVKEMLANAYYLLESYDEASLIYKELLNSSEVSEERKEQLRDRYDKARFRSELMANPVIYDPVNIGSAVNSPEDEYINSISAEGNSIFFTRRTRQANYLRQFTEDIYLAAIEHDSMLNAELLMYPPGKEKDAAAYCLSPDGRQLFFTACYRLDSYGSCDLYFSEKKGSSWSPARNMGNLVNSRAWDAQPSISPDGKTLYFASMRPGGVGSSDLWKSERDSTGKWGAPVNLGPRINTSAQEMAPFIHPDNQSLYFSSAGHMGMGGNDIFRAQRIGNAWSEPQNLGYPLNSEADELVIVVSPDGETAYISSNSLEGYGRYDIYRFELDVRARPVPVSYLKGKVFDKQSGNPLEASFELVDLELDSLIIGASSDRQTGEFLVCLPCNRDYALHVSCPGYLFYSEHFPLSGETTWFDPVIKDIGLDTVTVGSSMAMRNIFYDTDKYELKPESFPELDRLVILLEQNPALRIEIGGHTDDVGEEDYNMELSSKRAASVYDYLINTGISPDRLTYKGYGESEPESTNLTEDGRALNRRTEITILSTE